LRDENRAIRHATKPPTRVATACATGAPWGVGIAEQRIHRHAWAEARARAGASPLSCRQNEGARSWVSVCVSWVCLIGRRDALGVDGMKPKGARRGELIFGGRGISAYADAGARRREWPCRSAWEPVQTSRERCCRPGSAIFVLHGVRRQDGWRRFGPVGMALLSRAVLHWGRSRRAGWFAVGGVRPWAAARCPVRVWLPHLAKARG